MSCSTRRFLICARAASSEEGCEGSVGLRVCGSMDGAWDVWDPFHGFSAVLVFNELMDVVVLEVDMLGPQLILRVL